MIISPLDITKDEQDRLFVRIPAVFSDGTPITKKQLFAGRRDQLMQLMGAVHHASQHAIIFGDRGIGKTSIAGVLKEFISAAEASLCTRINCGSADTFDTTWKKMFSLINVEVGEGEDLTKKTIAEVIGDVPVTPFIVQQQLTPISQGTHIVLIFDEFDTIEDQATRRLFAETIKTLSDFAVPATIVLVGIADSVDKLIAEHQSIERNLVQVRMPRMSPEELEQILITNGLGAIGMGIEDAAKKWILTLSQGLPNYTHSLGKNAALLAINDLKRNVGMVHVAGAIKKALEQTNHSIQNMYVTAVSSPRKNMLKEVLLACALAPTDSLGSFSASDVRGPFRRIMKDDSYDIPHFNPHLNDFSVKRGMILVKTGAKKSYRYRFREPVLQPYVIMEGLRLGLIDQTFFETK